MINTNSNYKDEKIFFFQNLPDKLSPDNFIICELESFNSTGLQSYKELNLDYIISKIW